MKEKEGYLDDMERMNLKKLNIEQLIKGACVCAENGYKLAQDARRLYSKKRYSTATALAISSLEELGKVQILSMASVMVHNKQIIEWRTFWKTWRNHKRKQFLASFLDLGLFGKDAITLAMRTMIFEDLNQLREQCLYVDFQENEWKTPKEIPRDWTVELLEAAESISSEIIKDINIRRYDLLIREIESIKTPITSITIKDHPFLMNLHDGFMEIENEIGRINAKIEKCPSKYGS